MIRRPPRSTPKPSSAASDVYKRQLLHKSQASADRAKEVLKFFDWSYKNGGAMASDLDYVAMPAPVVKLVQDAWKANVKDASGKAIW